MDSDWLKEAPFWDRWGSRLGPKMANFGHFFSYFVLEVSVAVSGPPPAIGKRKKVLENTQKHLSDVACWESGYLAPYIWNFE